MRELSSAWNYLLLRDADYSFLLFIHFLAQLLFVSFPIEDVFKTTCAALSKFLRHTFLQHDNITVIHYCCHIGKNHYDKHSTTNRHMQLQNGGYIPPVLYKHKKHLIVCQIESLSTH